MGIVGVDFMVKLCPKIVVAVEFDAAACTFGGDRGEEVCYSLTGGGVEVAHVIDAICGRNICQCDTQKCKNFRVASTGSSEM